MCLLGLEAYSYDCWAVLEASGVRLLRVSDVAVTPGGKGLNVARAALILRAPASLVGFIPGYTGRAAAAMISSRRSSGGRRRALGVVAEAGSIVTGPVWQGAPFVGNLPTTK